MAELSVVIESRIVGQSPDAMPLDPVVLDLLSEKITARELIRRAVTVQVHHLVEKRRIGAEQAQVMLDRQYMTREEVARQAEQGRVRYPSSSLPSATIDVEREVDKAMRAFKERGYFIMIDGEQIADLDEELILAPDSSITFLRLTPLVGG